MANNVYVTYYKVRFYDDIEDKIATAQGVLFASSFADASEQIEDYYGKLNVDAIEIHQLDETSVLEIKDMETWRKLFIDSGGSEAFKK